MKNQLYLLILPLILFSLSCTSQTIETKQSFETATFGAGCFWCTETIFEELKGVENVVSGYSGGHQLDPTYQEICTGTTGHAEVIQITYDPEIISFKGLLEVFWEVHDPTTLNQQGADIGTQYRSVIFYHSGQQKEEAEFYKNRLSQDKVFLNPIVTEISQAKVFYNAEKYHQDYYLRNTEQRYCRLVITPKLEKFKKVFANDIK